MYGIIKRYFLLYPNYFRQSLSMTTRQENTFLFFRMNIIRRVTLEIVRISPPSSKHPFPGLDLLVDIKFSTSKIIFYKARNKRKKLLPNPTHHSFLLNLSHRSITYSLNRTKIISSNTTCWVKRSWNTCKRKQTNKVKEKHQHTLVDIQI